MLLPNSDEMGVVRDTKAAEEPPIHIDRTERNATTRVAAPMAQANDSTLVAEAQRGNKESFKALVEKYQGRLFSLAVHSTGSKEDAEDIVQESFVKAWFSIRSFRGDSSITTWLHRIVSNMCIDFRRKYDKERSRSVAIDDVQGSELPSYDTVQPDEAISAKRDVSRLSSLLETLSPEHRQVILLREVDGLSYDEIAKSLGISKGTVMSRLHYARKRLVEGFEG